MRARARACLPAPHVHKCIYTYDYIDCTADEFADCTIYDCIGSIKRNENARATCAMLVRDPSRLTLMPPSPFPCPERWIKVLSAWCPPRGVLTWKIQARGEAVE
jgi:hypothetical protein